MTNRCTRRAVLAAGVLGSAGVVDVTTARQQGATTDWPMHQRDTANTGRQSTTTAPTEGVRVAWQVSTGAGRVTDPVVADGVVYVGNDDGHFLAYDAADGTRLWSHDVGASPTGVPVVTGDTVYFGIEFDRRNPKLQALNVADGSQRWWSDAALIAPRVTAHDGTIYARGRDRFHAIDAATGGTRWTLDREVVQQVTPAISDGALFTNTGQGIIRALDPADGTERWQFEVPGRANGAPTVAQDTVYVASGNVAGRLTALDVADGTERWHAQLDHHGSGSPAIADGRVYVGTIKQWISAFDAVDGTRVWRTENRGVTASSPAIVGDTLYYSSLDKHLYALSTTDGSQRWQFGTGNTAPTSPVIANGRIYVGAGDGTLYALAPDQSPLPVSGPGVLGAVAALGGAVAHRRLSEE